MPRLTKITKLDQLKNLPFAEACDYFDKHFSGKNYFKDLTNFIAQRTGVSYVLVGYPESEDLTQIKTAVLYAGGQFVENYHYSLQGTPCENVIGRNCCYYPSGIQQMFPADDELKKLGIESYIGLPIFSNEKYPIGLLALMDTKLIQNPKQIEAGLLKLMPGISKELKAYTAEAAQLSESA